MIVTRTLVLAGLIGLGCSSSTSDAGQTAGENDGPSNVSNSHGTRDGGPADSDPADSDSADSDSANNGLDSPAHKPLPDGGDGSDPNAGSDNNAADGGSPTDNVVVSDCEIGVPATSQVPRLLNREYDAIMEDLLGVTALAAADGQPPSTLLEPDSKGELSDSEWTTYQMLADAIASEVMAGPNANRFIDCDPASSECLQTTIRTFGRKVFRRPLTDAEVDQFMGLADVEPKGTPTEIAEAILYAFLVSPSFILVSEVSEDVDPTTGLILLTDYEIATRLGLLIWGSIPDDELNAAADAGELRTPEQILAQAQRMSQDRDKTGRQLVNANRYYAMSNQLRWGVTQHDPETFPTYASDEEVNPAMMAELDAFFEEVAYQGSFPQLFTSNVGFVNQATAPIYGLNPSDFGTDLTRVEFEGNDRPGFLTRVAFLSSFSREDRTAPTWRGAYIVELLGGEPGAISSDNSPTVPAPADYSTNREVIEALTSVDASCVACHNLVNPPGFVLEVYDAVGAIQSIDALGGEIDGTADVELGPGDTQKITSPAQLMDAIVQAPLARRKYARDLVAFATKREPNPNDACIVDSLTQALEDDNFLIRDYVDVVVQADSFRMRKPE